MTWSSFSVRMCRACGIPIPLFLGTPPSRDKVCGHGWLSFFRALLSLLYTPPNLNQNIGTRSNLWQRNNRVALGSTEISV